eukprot:294466_1
MEICQEEFNVSYNSFAVINSMVSLLVISLLIQTIFHAHKKKKLTKIVGFTIGFQTTLLIFLFSDSMKYVIGSHLNWVENKSFCRYCSTFIAIPGMIFYLLLLNVLMFRLIGAFQGSAVALTSKGTQILFAIINIPYICGVLSLPFLWWSNSCIMHWNPVDNSSNTQPLHVCMGDQINISIVPKIILYLLYFHVIAFNIILTGICVYKLQKILKESKVDYSMQYVMVKITVLAVSGSSASLFSWLVFILLPDRNGYCLLYIDMFWNSLMIVLMFEYNKKYYSLLCKPCIKLFMGAKETTEMLGKCIELDASKLPTNPTATN